MPIPGDNKFEAKLRPNRLPTPGENIIGKLGPNRLPTHGVKIGVKLGPNRLPNQEDKHTVNMGPNRMPTPGENQPQDKMRPPKNQIRSILFVPRTNRGELLTRLRLGENKLAELLGSRVKLVERGGLKLSATLTQKNPWGDAGCGRGGCKLCEESDSNS